MSADSIPKQLQYGASASVARVVRVSNIRPAGTDSGTYGDSFRFVLPSRSIVDLGSLSLYYTASINNLIDGVNGVNAVMPASWKHFKRVVFYVSGVATSGSLNQHMDMLYHALVKSSGSHEWLLSRLNKNAIEAVLSTDECAAHQTLKGVAFTPYVVSQIGVSPGFPEYVSTISVNSLCPKAHHMFPKSSAAPSARFW